MEGRVTSMGIDIKLEVYDETTNICDVMAMLNNLEDAIKTYVRYDRESSEIESFNLYRTGPFCWRIGAVIDAPKPIALSPTPS